VMTRPEAAGPIAQATARASTVVIPGAGHMSIVERPDEVNAALLGFLATVDSTERGVAG
jgi:pimeloyl-ACP methyl ester carboxylesterase